MKKRIKLIFTAMIIATLVMLEYPTSDFVSAKNTKTYLENDTDDGVVLGYYDISTGKETLYTEEQLEREYSIDAKSLKGIIKTEARNASKEYKKKKMTNSQKMESMCAIEDASISKINPIFQWKNKVLGNQIANNLETQNSLTSVTNDYSDRILVQKNSSYYNRVCKIIANGVFYDGTTNSKFNGISSGTGFAVGKNLCATARHCITDSYGNWMTDIKAYYGFDGDTNEYTNLLTNVKGYVFFPSYITGYETNGTIKTDWNYDVAFLIWDTETVQKTGCFGMVGGFDEGETPIRIAGYPSALGGKRMYTGVGMLAKTTATKLWYSGISTSSGDSGAPLFSESLYAYGVHTHSDWSGRRFDSELIQWFWDNGYVS